MDALRQDLVYAFRNLRKSPGYAAVTVLTLALGIGANSAIFSVVNGVLLKPLPYPQPERLVFITSQFPTLGFNQFWVSSPEFLELRERNEAFAEVGAYRAGAVNLGTEDQPRRVNSAVVTSELMPVLGVAPIRGRQFTREDTLPGAEGVDDPVIRGLADGVLVRRIRARARRPHRRLSEADRRHHADRL